MEDGFNRVDAEIRALRAETQTQFVGLRGEMNARFDAMQRLIIQVGGGMIVTVLFGFLGVIVTQG